MERIDISQLAHEVGVLDAATRRQRAVVVVPLEPGKRELVREFLAEGPPFDPQKLGIDRHEVFVTDAEAIFVFEAAAGLRGLERILAENEFWDVVTAWEHVIAGPPRLAEVAFTWHASR